MNPRAAAHGTPEPKEGYRPGVGVMLVNGQGLIFVARRIDTPGDAWQMPQGGIDGGETPVEAALRELEEEIGTGRAEVLAETPYWLDYELPPEIAGRIWGGKYSGQTQKWFLLRFTGDDRDIDLDHHDHPEFSDWKWAALEDLPRLIVPFKRRLYEDVVAAFEDSVRKVGGKSISRAAQEEDL